MWNLKNYVSLVSEWSFVTNKAFSYLLSFQHTGQTSTKLVCQALEVVKVVVNLLKLLKCQTTSRLAVQDFPNYICNKNMNKL